MTVRKAVIRDVDRSNLPASLKEHIISPAEHKEEKQHEQYERFLLGQGQSPCDATTYFSPYKVFPAS
jgi:hypothetical protein